MGLFNCLVEQISENIWIGASVFICIVVGGGFYYYENTYTYWSKRGVKSDIPLPLVGDLFNVLFKDRLGLERERVEKYGKVYGSFQSGKPCLNIADPDVLRQICIKDFDVFTDHRVDEFANKYQKNFLTWIRDQHWKRVRSLMSPTFTSSKIRRMFVFLNGCAEDLIENFKEQLSGRDTVLNVSDVFSLYTIDGISTCCYGLKLERKSGNKDIKSLASRNSFIEHSMSAIETKFYKLVILTLVPRFILRKINFELIDESVYQPIVDRMNTWIQKRRDSPKKYEDMLQLLVDAKLDDELELNDMDLAENHHAGLTRENLVENQKKLISHVEEKQKTSSDVNTAEFRLNNLEILSEAIFLLAAGLETTRTLLTNCAYVLAFHPDLQEKLYNELRQIVVFDTEKRQHSFDYESLTSCQYLDAFISETLRFLSPAPKIDRIALNDYYIEKYKIHVPKGTNLWLCLYAVGSDPDYWDKPEKFNPDRFMPGQKENIKPGTYAPFGLGPRHCIGMRFSLTEAKLGLAKVVMRFKFAPAPNTQFPPKFQAKAGILNVLRDPRVKVCPRREAF